MLKEGFLARVCCDVHDSGVGGEHMEKEAHAAMLLAERDRLAFVRDERHIIKAGRLEPQGHGGGTRVGTVVARAWILGSSRDCPQRRARGEPAKLATCDARGLHC